MFNTKLIQLAMFKTELIQLAMFKTELIQLAMFKTDDPVGYIADRVAPAGMVL